MGKSVASSGNLPFVSVIIANYNGDRSLRECLRAMRQRGRTPYEIIVVDELTRNFEDLSSEYPEFTLIRLDGHAGAAAARNIGVRMSKGEFLVFLDNDTQVSAEWLDKLIAPMLLDSRIAVAEPKLLRMDRRDIIDGVGDFIDAIGLTYPLGKGEQDLGQYDEPREIFSARTACAIVRRRVFDITTGFDDAFNATFEDVDLGWRIRLLGYRIESCPSSIVYHAVGRTRTKRSDYAQQREQVKNHIAMVLKNFSAARLIRVLPNVAVLYIFRIIGNVIRRRMKVVLGILSGVAWPIVNFRNIWKKRLYVQRSRRISDSDLDSFILPSPLSYQLVALPRSIRSTR